MKMILLNNKSILLNRSWIDKCSGLTLC